MNCSDLSIKPCSFCNVNETDNTLKLTCNIEYFKDRIEDFSTDERKLMEYFFRILSSPLRSKMFCAYIDATYHAYFVDNVLIKRAYENAMKMAIIA